MTPEEIANTPGMGTQGIGVDTALAAAPPASPYDQMVRDAYGSIGRTGFGTEASNIDQAGFDYWVNTLATGQSTPEAFGQNFQTAVFDYMGKNPQDQYSAYVADYLQKNNSPEIADVQQLYRDVLGRDADAGGLGYWLKQFGSEVSHDEFDVFETSAKNELNSRVRDLYTDFLGREAEDEGVEYWRNQFGSSIDDTEREQFRKTAATAINEAFGVTDPAAAPNTEGVLSGFKYAKDLGITEEGMKKTLGEDVFNTYKTGFADYAKTGIANILADDQLSFDEARQQVKFGRDYGYDAQKLADLTGVDKSVFDAVYKGYDETADKIIDSVLGAEDVKTDTDRVLRSLALQKEFDFNDEDLAKATGYDVAKLKESLDPVRNFGTDLNKILSNSDSTLADTKKFLEAAKTNEAINQLYGANLGTLDTKIAEIEDRWKDYKDVDPMQAQRVFDQIGQQREKLGGQYYRGVFGDPMTMAATLAKKGIDTLADIGQKDKFESVPAEKRYFAPDGSQVYDLGNGTFGVPDADGGVVSTVPKSQVRTEYGKIVADEYGSSFEPLSKEELATIRNGAYRQKIGSVAIDKDTGKEIAGLDGTIASEKSGKWYNKKDNDLNVGFNKDGTPILYTTEEKRGFGAALQQALPVISMMLPFMLPGLGAGLSGLLPGAGVAASGATAAIAPTLMNQALTQGILSGGLSTLSGGDFGKGFLGGAVSPLISTGISNLLPAGMDKNAARAITGAGTGVVKGALQGGDFSDLLGQGVLSGLTNYGLGEATRGLNLTPQQLNFATGIALPLAQGQKVNPVKLATTLASATR
jgi:hypothetical protein